MLTVIFSIGVLYANLTSSRIRPVVCAGDKNISLLHLSCRTSDLQF